MYLVLCIDEIDFTLFAGVCFATPVGVVGVSLGNEVVASIFFSNLASRSGRFVVGACFALSGEVVVVLGPY